MTKDYIIVGRGLAGSVLALRLMEEGKSVLLIDSPNLSKSSKIAAGLFNPVVFKRLTRSWNIDLLLAEAESFYTSIEKTIGDTFFHFKNIIKLFSESQEEDLWKDKSEKQLALYLDSNIYNDGLLGCKHKGTFGRVKNAGYLDVGKFLATSRNYISNNASIAEEEFNFELFNISTSGVTYKGIAASAVIFCDGAQAIHNPYFPKGAFKLTKGELLTIKMEGFVENETVNKGVFILPVGNNTYKVGATYNWDELDETPSESGLKELKEKLESVIGVPYTILSHEASIRPTVVDRRPLIGGHPEHRPLFFLNGLGTKGVLHAPYCSKQLISHIQCKTPIEKELDINRYF